MWQKLRNLSYADRKLLVTQAITLLSSLTVGFVVFTKVYMDNYYTKVCTHIEDNVIEYEDDLELGTLCNLAYCKSLTIREGNIVLVPVHGILQTARPNFKPTHTITDIVFKDSIVIDTKLGAVEIEMDLSEEMIFLVHIFTVFTSFLILLFSLNSIRVIYSLNITRLEDQKRRESLAANKMLGIMADNIRHELNASIIKTVTYLDGIRAGFDFDYVDTEEQLVLIGKIESNMETATGVLNVMAGIKEMKFSNGNKNLYDIISLAFQSVVVFSKDRTIEIDESLKCWSVDHSNLSNGALTHILTNLFTNSLEAQAKNLQVRMDRVAKEGICTFYLIDNGTGVPEHLHKDLFKADTSSKGAMHGNGLFTGKEILNAAHGDISLYFAEKGVGTTFKIEVIVELFKGGRNDTTTVPNKCGVKPKCSGCRYSCKKGT